MKTVQESMRSMSKRYSIVVVIIVISVLSITTSFIVMTQKQQHTTFAQLQGQESLNFTFSLFHRAGPRFCATWGYYRTRWRSMDYRWRSECYCAC